MQSVSTPAVPSPDSVARMPPLAISDLLVLTMTIGLTMACIAPDLQEFLALPQEERRIATWRALVPTIADYVAIGLTLFGLLVLGCQRLRGSTVPLAPGHWIFLAVGPYYLLLLISGAWSQVIAAYWFKEYATWDAAHHVLFAIVCVSSAACVSPALRRLSSGWRICLILLSVWLLLMAAWCVNQAFFSWSIWRRHLLVATAMTYLLAYGVACACVVREVIAGTRRDWLHYLAMVAFTFAALGNFFNYDLLMARWWGDLWLFLGL